MNPMALAVVLGAIAASAPAARGESAFGPADDAARSPAKAKDTDKDKTTDKDKDKGAAEAEPGAPLRMLVPGFTVRELPVQLTNVNNVEYGPDGQLFAAGYDGRLHVLRDTDGDGLEDQARTFFDRKSEDYPLGMAVRGRSVFVVRWRRIERHEDTDGDGVPDRVDVAAQWEDPKLPPEFLDQRRVGGGLGLAIGEDGSFYVSIGSLNTFRPYMLAGPDGKPVKPGEEGRQGVRPRYALDQPAGVVLKFAPDGSRQRIVATGVRYLTCMQFNRHGDLFATDQEGATWLPNGNPFDELLHLQEGRHYGFPPRHPRYLPRVIDEPSVFNYAPQHESTCGFRFNEPPRGADDRHAPVFGPKNWRGDALVTGESRGKLYRTELVKTPAGYVARSRIIARMGLLPVDVALSPSGALVVACHTGAPDWGSGPSGPGRIFKIAYSDRSAAQPLAAWAASPTETRIEFDRPLRPDDWKGLAQRARAVAGPYVTAGDRFESIRPGYAVVQAQSRAPRREVAVVSAALGADGRSILLRTARRTRAESYAFSLPFAVPSETANGRNGPRAESIELAHDLAGVEASWRSASGAEHWAGWLPHLDWSVASRLTASSAFHDELRAAAQKAGALSLACGLDLASMLHPAVQPGSKLDYSYPPETVTLRFQAGSKLELAAPSPARVVMDGPNAARLVVAPEPGRAVPLTLKIATGEGPLSLSVAWSTADDPRPRALSPRRVLLPWAVAPRDGSAETIAPAPEIAGGDWRRGRALFLGEKAGCSACHAVRGEGGAIGPDLSNLIHRDYASVLKDVREPSAAINPDFLSYAVALEDGRVLTGVLNGSTAETVRVASSDGKIVTVPRSEVAQIAPSKISAMPDKLVDRLAADELRDLMTYLLADRPPAR